ncbi:hypothetical protein FA95DRAFT_1599430 [Auriscalpium vulgare]|uniref:Uncharacterized protein n=1 Tax=Auriscalpium vulgare TaxID=40419 RepID=A0ACB8R8M2_9AGAM|nr:hypothetical protein FA95DRAFT_1599430 [Auriscalpium vulgare]
MAHCPIKPACPPSFSLHSFFFDRIHPPTHPSTLLPQHTMLFAVPPAPQAHTPYPYHHSPSASAYPAYLPAPHAPSARSYFNSPDDYASAFIPTDLEASEARYRRALAEVRAAESARAAAVLRHQREAAFRRQLEQLAIQAEAERAQREHALQLHREQERAQQQRQFLQALDRYQRDSLRAQPRRAVRYDPADPLSLGYPAPRSPAPAKHGEDAASLQDILDLFYGQQPTRTPTAVGPAVETSLSPADGSEAHAVPEGDNTITSATPAAQGEDVPAQSVAELSVAAPVTVNEAENDVAVIESLPSPADGSAAAVVSVVSPTPTPTPEADATPLDASAEPPVIESADAEMEAPHSPRELEATSPSQSSSPFLDSLAHDQFTFPPRRGTSAHEDTGDAVLVHGADGGSEGEGERSADEWSEVDAADA